MKCGICFLVLVSAFAAAAPPRANQPATDRAAALAIIKKEGIEATFNESLPGKPLVKLDFGCERCTRKILPLFSALKEVQELSLRLEPDVTEKDLEPLQQLVNLESFTAHHTRFADKCLRHLKGLPKLRSVSLIVVAPFSQGELAHLSALPRLEKLKLRAYGFTDESVVYLKGLKGLLHLDLAGTQITDQGIGRLKDLTNLQTLILPAKATRAAAKALQKALPKAKIIGGV